eukprot:TRINITY_DN6761_c0_g1_i1.p1 TRINITY_DN6761_c0_g1~~TRINITY_DN6761_c0_g1_i1.p1  ORF type:complete len:408 (-),score=100.98 TRINITY_DN6761_c0_g1_i1:206-1429(-)
MFTSDCKRLFFVSFSDVASDVTAEATAMKNAGVSITTIGVSSDLTALANDAAHSIVLLSADDLTKYADFFGEGCSTETSRGKLAIAAAKGDDNSGPTGKTPVKDDSDSDSDDSHDDNDNSDNSDSSENDESGSGEGGGGSQPPAEGGHKVDMCYKPNTPAQETISVCWNQALERLNQGAEFGRCGGAYTGECAVGVCVPATITQCTTIPIVVVARGTAATFDREAFKAELALVQGIDPNSIVIVSVTDIVRTTKAKFQAQSNEIEIVFVERAAPAELEEAVQRVTTTVNTNERFRSHQGIVNEARPVATPQDSVKRTAPERKIESSSPLRLGAIVIFVCVFITIFAAAVGFYVWRKRRSEMERVKSFDSKDLEAGQLAKQDEFLQRLEGVFPSTTPSDIVENPLRRN